MMQPWKELEQTFKNKNIMLIRGKILYLGLIGSEGLEGFFEFDSKITNLNSLKLRCRFNQHRNLKLFSFLGDNDEIEKIKKEKNPVKAGRMLLQHEQFNYI